jgi:hypothetical protein
MSLEKKMTYVLVSSPVEQSIIANLSVSKVSRGLKFIRDLKQRMGKKGNQCIENKMCEARPKTAINNE